MNVKLLRQLLDSYADDDVVLLSRDPEGNGYAELSGAADGFWHRSDRAFYTEQDIADCRLDASTMRTAICLWPSE